MKRKGNDMVSKTDYDFAGWATKNDLRCADHRIIRRNAFSGNDGKIVPLVWNHQHNTTSTILGHALLENREDGVYAYGKFNNTTAGKEAKEILSHGDVTHMSIWANNLEHEGSSVVHGVIREVSLVLAGANPGAFVESVLSHGEPMDDYDEEGIFYTNDGITLSHAISEKKEGEKVAEQGEKKSQKDGEETVGEVFNTLTEKQKQAVAIIVGQAISDARGSKSEKEDDDVKHNIFEGEIDGTYLSHAEIRKQEEEFFKQAKRIGSLRDAIRENIEQDGFLAHAVPMDGMIGPSGTTVSQDYGFRDPDMLFPDYRTMNNPPEWISRDMGWVSRVMNGVHKTPYSRIKSVYADITEEEARAKGYIKGKQKKTEVFTLLKRTTSPTTIYKLQKMDRDDIIDITEFDVVAWIRAEMRLMLNEEIARAILIGDGRQPDSDDHIKEDCIRPIVKDVDLFNVKIYVDRASLSSRAEKTKATIDAIIRARRQYKGSGNPLLFTTEDELTEMLLLEDGIGHKLYKSVQELATALRVSDIVTVEPMEGYEVEIQSTKYPLIGVIVNLNDYNVGTDRGGEVNTFEDFDIDFNKYTYLIETRMSGALVKPFSALTIVEGKENP